MLVIINTAVCHVPSPTSHVYSKRTTGRHVYIGYCISVGLNVVIGVYNEWTYFVSSIVWSVVLSLSVRLSVTNKIEYKILSIKTDNASCVFTIGSGQWWWWLITVSQYTCADLTVDECLGWSNVDRNSSLVAKHRNQNKLVTYLLVCNLVFN